MGRTGATTCAMFRTACCWFLLFHWHCFAQAKICVGNRAYTAESKSYERLEKEFRDCTVVLTNVAIQDRPADGTFRDYSFLENITEIHGYLFLFRVDDMKSLPLKNLRLISGTNVIQGTGQSSLSIDFNQNLQYLGFQSLAQVTRNNIYIRSNQQLCGLDRDGGRVPINWDDIVGSQDQRIIITGNKLGCPVCTCNGGGCWDPDNPAMPLCQKLSRIDCHDSCSDRCTGLEGPVASDCCDSECIAGCNGPSESNCYACKNFLLDPDTPEQKCVSVCPGPKIYNPDTGSKEDNPDPRFHLNRLCLAECPEEFFQFEDECLRSCPNGYYTQTGTNGSRATCEPCGDACPKSCGNGDEVSFTVPEHSRDNSIFTNCTEFRGDLKIWDSDRNIIQAKDLEVLRNLRRVTGSLKVQFTYPVDFTSFGFLENLEEVSGQGLSSTQTAVSLVTAVGATGVTEFGLKSFKKITIGSANVFMQSVCNSTNPFLATLANGVALVYNVNKSCSLECHEECGSNGCWGDGDDYCVNCEHLAEGDRCLGVCSTDHYRSGKLCLPCHDECEGGCSGPKDTDCIACRNYRDVNTCVPKCDIVKYAAEDGTCQRCNDVCFGLECTGPSDAYGEGGCSECFLHVADDASTRVEKCINKTLGCPDRYFSTTSFVVHDNTFENKRVCERCDDHCLSCKRSAQSCIECTYFSYIQIQMKNGQAIPRQTCTQTNECPHNMFQSGSKNCSTCHEECENGCTGTAQSDCIRISNAGVIGGAVGGFVVVVIVVGAIVAIVMLRQRSVANRKALELEQQLAGPSEEPLCVTEALPDRSTLRLINDTDLKIGGELGSGAFGTVYSGFWHPTDRKGAKLAVAVKVLKDESPDQNEELLAEARVMASVNNDHCVRLLAVCMTRQIMLITPLMPSGGILEYIRKHKGNIGSRTLLNWCLQIAKGMKYLEDRKLVHRDLAARNVLLKSPNFAKITDFGLSKMLEYNTTEYEAVSGKMPIKWMALESIEHRVFTSKTDVWSFGVTIWELFTFGARPYEAVRAREMLSVLSRGQRLSQPSICTLDVYMIMVKCWVLGADSRPTFGVLVDEFARMAKDPGRYLVIEGDTFMRLDSVTSDAGGFFKDLNFEENTEGELLDADEYLKPESVRGHSMSSMDDYTARKSLSSPPLNGSTSSGRAALRSDGSVRYCTTPSKTPGNAGYYPDSGNGSKDDSSKFGDFPSPDSNGASFGGKFVDIDATDSEAVDGYLQPQSVVSESEYLQPVDRKHLFPYLQVLPESQAVSFSNFNSEDFARSSQDQDGLPKSEAPAPPNGAAGLSYANVFDDGIDEPKPDIETSGNLANVSNPEYLEAHLTSV